MGYSVYCAICAGPFSSNVEIDPEETDDDDGYYRDKVLRGCNLEWLDDVCGLGINPDAPGDDKSFVSGVGEHWDNGELDLARGDDPNAPLTVHDPVDYISATSYRPVYGSESPYVFPFHQICYKDIFLRCIHREYEQIRRDVLFDAMEYLTDTSGVRLKVLYGDPDPPAEQAWPSIKGQEVLVVNPVEIPQLDAELAPIMEALNKQGTLDQGSQTQDIFNRLPLELRHMVFGHLPAGSILALKAASFAMHTTTLPPKIWAHRLSFEIPWLWEIHDIDLFQSQEVEEKASRLLLDIQKKSQYTSENDDYILGLANRSRIWSASDAISYWYGEKLRDRESELKKGWLSINQQEAG